MKSSVNYSSAVIVVLTIVVLSFYVSQAAGAPTGCVNGPCATPNTTAPYSTGNSNTPTSITVHSDTTTTKTPVNTAPTQNSTVPTTVISDTTTTNTTATTTTNTTVHDATTTTNTLVNTTTTATTTATSKNDTSPTNTTEHSDTTTTTTTINNKIPLTKSPGTDNAPVTNSLVKNTTNTTTTTNSTATNTTTITNNMEKGNNATSNATGKTAYEKRLIPKFLAPKLTYFNIGPEMDSLAYFDVNRDASKVRWEREANSRQAVKAAVNNEKVHMISGDVILKDHGTKSQKLVPIMAKPSSPTSDITLKEWLQEVRSGTKGIRLHFHSMESVEISIQILSDFHKQNPIKFPIWLHANVLKGPHGEEAVIDHNRFIRAIQRQFPKCTISLGWTTGTHTDLTQSAYEWQMVWDMLNLVQEFEFEEYQQIIFQARLSLIHNSVPQLKWICDNVKQSKLMIWHEDGDVVVNEDIMYVSYRFPPHGVYFDLNHDRFQNLLDQYRHFSRDKVNPLVLQRDERVFKPDGWWKMGFHKQKNSVLASTEGIILTSPIVYLVSKSKYMPTSEIYIQGRIQFFNREGRDTEDHVTGLNIYLRSTDYSRFDNLVGIRCFIGVGGEIEVTGSNLPDNVENFRKSARVTPTHNNCYRFKIVDERSHISFTVYSLHDCTTLESVAEEDPQIALLTVPIPSKLLTNEQRPFVLKMNDVKRQVLIDELSIKHK